MVWRRRSAEELGCSVTADMDSNWAEVDCSLLALPSDNGGERGVSPALS